MEIKTWMNEWMNAASTLQRDLHFQVARNGKIDWSWEKDQGRAVQQLLQQARTNVENFPIKLPLQMKIKFPSLLLPGESFFLLMRGARLVCPQFKLQRSNFVHRCRRLANIKTPRISIFFRPPRVALDAWNSIRNRELSEKTEPRKYSTWLGNGRELSSRISSFLLSAVFTSPRINYVSSIATKEPKKMVKGSVKMEQ